MKQNDLDEGKTHLGKPEVRGEQLDKGNGRVDTWREKSSKTKKKMGEEKLGVACGESFKVYSVFSVASVSGWIYVEAPTSRDVQQGLGDINGVRGRIKLISIRDAGALLDLRTGSLALTENSWVRIRRGLYRGDLAYVRCCREERVDKDDDHDEDIEHRRIAAVKLIPRIPLSPQNEGTGSKRKRPVNRPHSHFFDNHVISRAYGIQLTSETREGPNGEEQLLWRFQKDTYCNGLLELDIALNMLNMDPAIAPNQDELSRWSSCPDLDIRKHASELLKSTIVGSGFWPGDRVQVLGAIEDASHFEVEDKEIVNLRWIVLVIIGNEAMLQLDQELVSDVSKPEIPADALRQRFCDSIRVSLEGLRKTFRTGDFVRVMSGRDEGRHGWVVAWDADKDTVFLSDQRTHTHVSA
jgi:transcription elongation factor SPT5